MGPGGPVSRITRAGAVDWIWRLSSARETRMPGARDTRLSPPKRPPAPTTEGRPTGGVAHMTANETLDKICPPRMELGLAANVQLALLDPLVARASQDSRLARSTLGVLPARAADTLLRKAISGSLSNCGRSGRPLRARRRCRARLTGFWGRARQPRVLTAVDQQSGGRLEQ